MDIMSKLGDFNISLYITNMERTISVLSKIDKKTDYIKTTLSPGDLTKRETSDNIKYNYASLLSVLKETFVINDFGVNSLAIGLYQVWFKLDPFTEEPEFVFLNFNV